MNSKGPSAIIITYPVDYVKKEAEALARSAGYEVLSIVTQRYLTRSKYGIGIGKVKEVKLLVENLRPDYIIFDEVITPSQVYNLAKELQCEIIDRERLILEIFEKRAKSAESSIQVKLAMLRYEISRIREKIRLAKKGEQPGFYGLGRYEVDDYYRDIKRRISILKAKLTKVANRRGIYRYNREREGLITVSLAGYTNAGKTTLFNILTNESREISKSMFTTLTTYTRSLKVRDGKILLSDTVGFISKLPPYMIEAFKSTLEELRYARLVLLVIDISEPIEELIRKYNSCLDILNKLEVNPQRILHVFNKIDVVNEDDIYKKIDHIKPDMYVTISAKKGINIDKLKEVINYTIFKGYKRDDIPINNDNTTTIRT